MLDSYTSSMCMTSWGKKEYARALIEVSVEEILLESMVIAIPFGDGTGHSLATIDIEYEWRPPRCDNCRIFDHTNESCPKNPKVAEGVGIRYSSKSPLNLKYRKIDKGNSSKPDENMEQPKKMKPKDPIVTISNSFNALDENKDEEKDDEFWGSKEQWINSTVLNESDTAWNIRGLNFSPKQNEVRQVCPFIFDIRTGQLMGNLCSKGTRIMIGWNKYDVDVTVIAMIDQVIHIRIWLRADKKELFCSFVYGHNKYSHRRILWDNLLCDIRMSNDALFSMGNDKSPEGTDGYTAGFLRCGRLWEADVVSANGYYGALNEFKCCSLGFGPSLPRGLRLYFCNVLNYTKIAILQIMPFEEGVSNVNAGELTYVKSICCYRVYFFKRTIRGRLCFVLEMLNKVTPPDTYSVQAPSGGVTVWYQEPRKRVRPLPTHRLAERHPTDHSSSDSSSEASLDSYFGLLILNLLPRHLLSDHSSPDLPGTSAGPSRRDVRTIDRDETETVRAEVTYETLGDLVSDGSMITLAIPGPSYTGLLREFWREAGNTGIVGVESGSSVIALTVRLAECGRLRFYDRVKSLADLMACERSTLGLTFFEMFSQFRPRHSDLERPWILRDEIQRMGLNCGIWAVKGNDLTVTLKEGWGKPKGLTSGQSTAVQEAKFYRGQLWPELYRLGKMNRQRDMLGHYPYTAISADAP
ncbi:hypothetical protein Tco_1291791 [Tanacetum coccineum]